MCRKGTSQANQPNTHPALSQPSASSCPTVAAPCGCSLTKVHSLPSAGCRAAPGVFVCGTFPATGTHRITTSTWPATQNPEASSRGRTWPALSYSLVVRRWPASAGRICMRRASHASQIRQCSSDLSTSIPLILDSIHPPSTPSTHSFALVTMNPAITNLAVSLGAMQSEYGSLPRPSTPPLHFSTRVTIAPGRPISFAPSYRCQRCCQST